MSESVRILYHSLNSATAHNRIDTIVACYCQPDKLARDSDKRLRAPGEKARLFGRFFIVDCLVPLETLISIHGYIGTTTISLNVYLYHGSWSSLSPIPVSR